MCSRLNAVGKLAQFLLFSRCQVNSSRQLSLINCRSLHNKANEVIEADPNGKSAVGETRSTPSLFSNEALDEGDLKEDAYISFTALDRKTPVELKNDIRSLIQNKKLKDALHLFEVERKSDKVKPLRGMYTNLIGECGRVGYTKKAFSLYNEMKKRGWDPSPSIYTALFNSCANSPWPKDGLARAAQLRQQLKDKNMTLNSYQYHAMIKAFGRCGDFPTVLEIVDEMARNKIGVTTATFNFILQACISLGDGFRHALIMWRKMRKLDIYPDVRSYNLILRSARDCGIGDIVKEEPVHPVYLLESSTAEIPPETLNSLTVSEAPSSLPNFLAHSIKSRSLISLTSLDQRHNRLALLGGIGGFFNQMKKDKVTPDIKTITLLLETVASEPHQEKVLMEYAEKFKINLDVDFLNLLIKKRNLRQDTEGAKEVLRIFQERKMVPNIMTFGVLAMGCQSTNDAETLFNNMENAGFRINIEIFGSLLKNAIAKSNCTYLTDLMNRAIKWDLVLDEKAVTDLENFRTRTSKRMAEYDRGNTAIAMYGRETFRKSFKVFCFDYERWLKELKVGLKPHPWEQYRYQIEKTE